MLSLLNAATRESAQIECSFRFGAGSTVTARFDDGRPVLVSRGMCLTSARLTGTAPSGATMYVGRSDSIDGRLATSTEWTRVAGADLATGAYVRIAEGAVSDAPYVTALMRGAHGTRVDATLTVTAADDSPPAVGRATEPVEFGAPTVGGARVRTSATARPGAYVIPMSPSATTHVLLVEFVDADGLRAHVTGTLACDAGTLPVDVEPSDGGFLVSVTQVSTGAPTTDVRLRLAASGLTRAVGGQTWPCEPGPAPEIWMLAPLRLTCAGTYRAGTNSKQIVTFAANDALLGPATLANETNYTTGTHALVASAAGVERPSDALSTTLMVAFAGALSATAVRNPTTHEARLTNVSAASVAAVDERTGAAVELVVAVDQASTLAYRPGGAALSTTEQRVVLVDRARLPTLGTLRRATDGAYDATDVDGSPMFLHGAVPLWALEPVPTSVLPLGDVLLGNRDPAPPPVLDAARYIAVTPRNAAEPCPIVNGQPAPPDDAVLVRVAQRFRIEPSAETYALVCAPSIPPTLNSQPCARGVTRIAWPEPPGIPVPAAPTAARLWLRTSLPPELPIALFNDNQWKQVRVCLVDPADGTPRACTFSGTPNATPTGCSVRNVQISGGNLELEVRASQLGTARVAFSNVTGTPTDARYGDTLPFDLTCEIPVLDSSAPSPRILAKAEGAFAADVLDSTRAATIELTLPEPLRFAPAAQYDPRAPLLGSPAVRVSVTLDNYTHVFSSVSASSRARRVLRVTERAITIAWRPAATAAAFAGSAAIELTAPMCVAGAQGTCAYAAPYATLARSVPCAPPPAHFECKPHASGVELIVSATPGSTALVPSLPPLGTSATATPNVYASPAGLTSVTLPPCSFPRGGYLLEPRVIPVYASGTSVPSRAILARAQVPEIRFEFYDGPTRLYPCCVSTTFSITVGGGAASATNDGEALVVAALVAAQPSATSIAVSFPAGLVLSETKLSLGTMPVSSARRSAAGPCVVRVLARPMALNATCGLLDLSVSAGSVCGRAGASAAACLDPTDTLESPGATFLVAPTDLAAANPIAELLDGALVRRAAVYTGPVAFLVTKGMRARTVSGVVEWTALRSAALALERVAVIVAAQCVAYRDQSATDPTFVAGVEFVALTSAGQTQPVLSVGAVTDAAGSAVEARAAIRAGGSCVLTFASPRTILGASVVVRTEGTERKVPLVATMVLDGPYDAAGSLTPSAFWQRAGLQTRFYRALDSTLGAAPVGVASVVTSSPTYAGAASVAADADSQCVRLRCVTAATANAYEPFECEPTGGAVRVQYTRSSLAPAFAAELVGRKLRTCVAPTVGPYSLEKTTSSAFVTAGQLVVTGTTATSDVRLASAGASVEATVVYGAVTRYAIVLRIDCGASETRKIVVAGVTTTIASTGAGTAGSVAAPIALSDGTTTTCGREQVQIVVYATSTTPDLAVTDAAGAAVRYDRAVAEVRGFTLRSVASVRQGSYTVSSAFGTEAALTLTVVEACPPWLRLAVGLADVPLKCTIACTSGATRVVSVDGVLTTLVADSTGNAGSAGAPLDLRRVQTARCAETAGRITLFATTPAGVPIVVLGGFEFEVAYSDVASVALVDATMSATYEVTGATLVGAGHGFVSGAQVAPRPTLPYAPASALRAVEWSVTLTGPMLDTSLVTLDVAAPRVPAVVEPSVLCARGVAFDGRAVSTLATQGSGALELVLTPGASLVDATKVTLTGATKQTVVSTPDGVRVDYASAGASITVTLAADSLAVSAPASRLGTRLAPSSVFTTAIASPAVAAGVAPTSVTFAAPLAPAAGATYKVRVFPASPAVILSANWNVTVTAGFTAPRIKSTRPPEHFLGIADTVQFSGAGACALVDASGATLAYFDATQTALVGPISPGTYRLRVESTGAEMRVVVRDELPRASASYLGSTYAEIVLGAAPVASIADVVTTTGGYARALAVPQYPSGGLNGSWPGGVKIALGNTAAIDAPVSGSAVTMPFTPYVVVNGLRRALACSSSSNASSANSTEGASNFTATATAVPLPARTRGYALQINLDVTDNGVVTSTTATADIAVVPEPANCTLFVGTASAIAALPADYTAAAARCASSWASASQTNVAQSLALVYDAPVRVPSYVLKPSSAVTRPAAFVDSSSTFVVGLSLVDARGAAVASPTITAVTVDGATVVASSGSYTLNVYRASVVRAALSDGTAVFLGETIPGVTFTKSATTYVAYAQPTPEARVVALEGVTFAVNGNYAAAVSSSATPAVSLASRCGIQSAVAFALSGTHEVADILPITDLAPTVTYAHAARQKTVPPRQGATATVSFGTDTCTSAVASVAITVAAGAVTFLVPSDGAPFTLGLSDIQITRGGNRKRQAALDVPIVAVAVGQLEYASIGGSTLCAGATHTGLSFYAATQADRLLGATVTVKNGITGIGSTTVTSVDASRAYVGPLALTGAAGDTPTVTVTLASSTFCGQASFELTQPALGTAHTLSATLSPRLSRTACALNLGADFATATVAAPGCVVTAGATPRAWTVRYDTTDSTSVSAAVSGVTAAGATVATGSAFTLVFGKPIAFTAERNAALGFDQTPTVGLSCLATLASVSSVTLALRTAAGLSEVALAGAEYALTANALLCSTTTSAPCYVESVTVAATDDASPANTLTTTTHLAVAAGSPVAGRAFALASAAYARGTTCAVGHVSAWVESAQPRLVVVVGGAAYAAEHTPISSLQVAGVVRAGSLHALVNGAYVVLTSTAATAPASTSVCVGLAGAHVATSAWDDILELARACARIARLFALAPPTPSFPAPTLAATIAADNDTATMSNGAVVTLACSGTLAACHAVPYPGSRTRNQLTLAAVSGGYTCTNNGSSTPVASLEVDWTTGERAVVMNRSRYAAFDVTYDGLVRPAANDIAAGALTIVSGSALVPTTGLALAPTTVSSPGFTVAASATATRVTVAIADLSRRCFAKTIGFRELGLARRASTAAQAHGITAREASKFVQNVENLVLVRVPELTPWPSATIAVTANGTQCTVRDTELAPAAVLVSVAAAQTAGSSVALVVTATSGVALRTMSATLAAVTPPSALDLSVASSGTRVATIIAAQTTSIPCDVPAAAATKWFFGVVAEIGASTAREASAGVRIDATVPAVTIRCAPASLAVTVGGSTYNAPVPPLGRALNALAIQIDTAQATVATAVRARIDGVALAFTLDTRAVSLVADAFARAPSASYVLAPGVAGSTSARVSLALVRANVDFDATDTWLNLECAARSAAPVVLAAEYDATYVLSNAVTTGVIAANGVPASLGISGLACVSKVVYSRPEPHALSAVSIWLARDASATISVEVSETAGSWTSVATQTTTGLERVLTVASPRPASYTRVVVSSTERVLRVAPTFVEPRLRVGVALVANGMKVRLTMRSAVGSSSLSRALSGTPTAVSAVNIGSMVTRRVGGVQTELCTLAAQMPTLPANLYATVAGSVVEAEPDPVIYAGVHYAALSAPTDVSIVSVLCTASTSTRALDFGTWSVSVARAAVSAAGQAWSVEDRDTHEVAVAWRGSGTVVYCDWVEVGTLATQTRALAAVGAQGQVSARFASLRYRAEGGNTTASVASFQPTWTAVLAASTDDCDDAGLTSHEYAALGPMPALPPLVPVISVAPTYSHVLRNRSYVFTVTSPISLEPFTVTTDPASTIVVTGTTATITTSGTSVSGLRVLLNGIDVTPASVTYPTLYDATTVSLAATAPTAIAPFEACVYATRDLALTVTTLAAGTAVPVSAVSVGTLTNCTAAATRTSSSIVTVACKATAAGASFELVLTGPDGGTVTLTKSLYVLSVPTPTLSIAAGALRAVGVQLSLVATYTVGSATYATDMSGLGFTGLGGATYSSKAASASTVLVTVTFTPASSAPTIGVRVSDRDSTPATLLDASVALGVPYVVPTTLTSKTCLDYPFPGDSLCMAGIDAAMSASVAVPTGTTLTTATRGLPGGPGTAYGITDATLTGTTLTFKMQPPTYVPTGAEAHTAVTFTLTGPDGHAFDVALVLTADSFLKWPSLLTSTTSEPEEIAVRASEMTIRFPFTGDTRALGLSGIATFDSGFSRADSQTGTIIPQTIVDHATTLTLTIAPRGSAPTRPIPASLTQSYLSATVPASRIVDRPFPTTVRFIGGHSHFESIMLRGDFETEKTTANASATVRGIGISEIRWEQGVPSKLHINESVSQKDPFIFARVTTSVRLVFSLSGVYQRVLAYDLPEWDAGFGDSNSHEFFTHETRFDSTRSSWSLCRAALKYCTSAVTGPPPYTARTLLVQNASTSKYELQDEYTTAMTARNDEITQANTHVRMITTNADTNRPPGGVLKLDLRLVTNYTRPFTIFGLRESSPNSESKPSIVYVTESDTATLVVRSPGHEIKLACTLPASCRIMYRYAGGLTGKGELTVLNASGNVVVTCTHSMPNFGNATSTPSYSTTSNGVAIFHHCVARAELVVSPNTQFTEIEKAALMTWAGANGAS